MKPVKATLAVQLNTTSVYDFLNSTIQIEAYLARLQATGQKLAPWVGSQQLFGIQKFLAACQKQRMQPIIGLATEVQIQNLVYKVVWYAKNKRGYRNLLQITQRSYNSQPLAWETVQSLTNDCHLVFCYRNQNDQAIILALPKQDWWDQISGFIGCEQLPPTSMIENLLSHVIPFQPVRYLDPHEQKKHRVLQAIKKAVQLNEITDQYDYSFQTKTQLTKQFAKSVFEVNLQRFCATCEPTAGSVPKLTIKPAQIPAEFQSSSEYLRQICQKQLTKEFGNQPIYQERFEYELKVIQERGWENYFLIVADYIQFSRHNNILVGPGRGSACGSLICYLLQITSIDPIQYKLIFERFLNPDLLQKPDIDTDFEDDKRAQIVKYLFTKYTNHHVAQITTIQTIGMKMALRDVGRVLDIELRTIDKICKAVNVHWNTDFQMAISQSYPLQKYQREYPELFKLVAQIINLPRQNGIHAAGLILTKQVISDFLPCFNDDQQQNVTQLDMYDIKQLGLIKMDLLGLRNLTLIQAILTRINHDRSPKLRLEQLPLNDQATFQKLASGDTLGLFQLESPGMRSLISKINPTSLEDIAATISLYRPGPMSNRALFIARKNGTVPDEYWIPAFKPVLANTFGVPLYQEQIMYLVRRFCQFSLAEADQLRYVISKKDKRLTEHLKANFWKKSRAEHHDEALIKRVWSLVAKFFDYGFNRSHAIAYALIAYWMGYLKTHYPHHFFLALLNKNLHDQTKTQQILLYWTRQTTNAIAISVNRSTNEYVWDSQTNQLLLPLNIIKKVGIVSAQKILSERQQHGPFKSLIDFIGRMLVHGFGKSMLKQLICANVFAEFNHNRATLLANLDQLLLVAQLLHEKRANTRQELLKTFPALKLERQADDWKLNLQCERASFGFLINYQFLRAWTAKLLPTTTYSHVSIAKLQRLPKQITKQHCTTGIIDQVTVFQTRQNLEMAFLWISDGSQQLKILVFNAVWSKIKTVLLPQTLVMVVLEKRFYQNQTSYLLQKLINFAPTT